MNEITKAPAIPATIIPPHLEILKGAQGLILSGVVEDEGMVRALDADAAMLSYGAAPFRADWAATAPMLRDIVSALQHVRISLDEDVITLAGLAASQEARGALKPHLAALRELGWRVEAAIDAPLPVLPDFSLTAARTADAGATLACAAATQSDADAIAAAARTHLAVEATCEIGAGAPDAAWADAATAIIAALASVPAADIEMTGKIVSLTVSPPTTLVEASAAKRDLSASLPPGYRLVVHDTAVANAGAAALPPFHMSIDWAGGDAPLTIAATQAETGFDVAIPTLSAYARAKFPGVKAVISRTDGAAPTSDWRGAARAALAALSHLERGSVEISAGALTLTGAAASHAALRAAHDTLTQAEGPWRATTRITYDPARIAAAQPAPPSRCAEDVAGVITEAPLSFQPASATLTAAAQTTVTRIAALLDRCRDARFEIGGHTDAQGSEAGNLALSRRRAEAVLTALLSANAAPGRLVAKGYGEAHPIAPNDTAVGRALNRRIEFTLIEDPK